jgi:hypothetical protein
MVFIRIADRLLDTNPQTGVRGWLSGDTCSDSNDTVRRDAKKYAQNTPMNGSRVLTFVLNDERQHHLEHASSAFLRTEVYFTPKRFDQFSNYR